MYRIHFYQLRLAKSDIFSPRLCRYLEDVDFHMNSQENSRRYKRRHLKASLFPKLVTNSLFFCSATTSTSNNLRKVEKKYAPAEPDWDSGYSDG
jgi:hypothetical protein